MITITIQSDSHNFEKIRNNFSTNVILIVIIIIVTFKFYSGNYIYMYLKAAKQRMRSLFVVFV